MDSTPWRTPRGENESEQRESIEGKFRTIAGLVKNGHVPASAVRALLLTILNKSDPEEPTIRFTPQDVGDEIPPSPEELLELEKRRRQKLRELKRETLQNLFDEIHKKVEAGELKRKVVSQRLGMVLSRDPTSYGSFLIEHASRLMQPIHDSFLDELNPVAVESLLPDDYIRKIGGSKTIVLRRKLMNRHFIDLTDRKNVGEYPIRLYFAKLSPLLWLREKWLHERKVSRIDSLMLKNKSRPANTRWLCALAMRIDEALTNRTKSFIDGNESIVVPPTQRIVALRGYGALRKDGHLRYEGDNVSFKPPQYHDREYLTLKVVMVGELERRVTLSLCRENQLTPDDLFLYAVDIRNLNLGRL